MAKSRPGRASHRYRAAAVCTPGLESICSDELQALGCKPKPGGPGIVEFDANQRQLYSANVWLRTASRIIVRVATFRATDFIHLQDHASRIEWDRWVGRGMAPRFRISSNDSKLYHTKAIAQRLHQVSLAPSLGEPEQLFIVRIDRNNVTISADSSGESLHKRPWRTELGQAPLRTTMAAAMLMASDWDPAGGLVDPFCGSGTIGIEAALMAAGLPPGGERQFAFQDWPDFDTGSWASVAGTVAAAARSVGPADPSLIRLSDRDGELVAAATRNAERAGVADRIEFENRVVSHIRAGSGPGLVITNPPYGKRMGRGELAGLYGRLGAVVRERLPGHAMTVLTPDAKLARAADGRLRSKAKFRHGGLAVEVFTRPAEPTNPSSPPAHEPARQSGDGPSDVPADGQPDTSSERRATIN
jgi:putative N6-adenine-specific DNA methylase